MDAEQFQQRHREGSFGVAGNEALLESQESETLRARIASEMRALDRLQRVARPVALIVFTVLAVLVILQLYTWKRLEQLTTFSQRHEEHGKAARASMQGASTKQGEARNETTPRLPAHASQKASEREKENGELATASPSPAPAQPSKPKKAPQPEPRHELSPAKTQPSPVRPPVPVVQSSPVQPPAPMAQPSPVQPPAPVVQRSPSRGISAMGQASTVYQNSPPNQPDLPANGAETAAVAGQGLVAQAGAEASESADLAGARPGPADTAIARDHNEIERLRQLGKRDYVEFTLLRSDSRRPVAPDISLELKKIDSKRLRCALNVYADDYRFSADLGINEPFVFPIRAMWESVELVINKVGKDSVGGYLAARKGVLGTR